MATSNQNADNPKKPFMTWRVEERHGPKEHQRVSAQSFSAVPMIPPSALGGSETLSVQNNAVLQQALTNPFVPVGMAATVGCLIGMCKATLNRNVYRAQLYMRGRCAAQFFTVCVLVGGAIYLGFNPNRFSSASPGSIPSPPDPLTKRFLQRNE